MQRIKRLGWTVVNAIQLVFTLSWSAFWISVALLIRLVTGSARVPLRMAAWLWSPALFLGAGARLEVSGRDAIDPPRPAVYVANHQSMIDVCALFAALPVPLRFVLKAELGRVPFLGWYARAMGMILIRRGRPHHARERLAEAAALLEHGHSLAAFPEGTRSSDGHVGRFKHGIFRAAISAGVPVVPIAIQGSGRVMPPGGFRIRPGRIHVTIGRAIDTTGLGVEQRQELAARARAEVVRLMQ